MDLRGVLPIVPTPFLADRSLDEPSLRRLLDYLIESGVHGVCVLGVASEGYALTDDERAAVMRAAVGQAAHRLPVLAGVSHHSAEAAVALARAAEADGVDGLLVMPPHFVAPTGPAIAEYFEQIAAAISVPIMVQDNPMWTGVQLPCSLFAELSEVDGIDSAKVEVGHPPTKMRELRAGIGERITLVGGLAGNWLLEELAAGSVGTMPASIMPQVYLAVWECWSGGHVAEARAIFDRFHPVIRVTAQQSVGFAMVKHVLWRLGVIETAEVRNPLRPLSADDRRDLDAVMEETQLLALMKGEPFR